MSRFTRQIPSRRKGSSSFLNKVSPRKPSSNRNRVSREKEALLQKEPNPSLGGSVVDPFPRIKDCSQRLQNWQNSRHSRLSKEKNLQLGLPLSTTKEQKIIKVPNLDRLWIRASKNRPQIVPHPYLTSQNLTILTISEVESSRITQIVNIQCRLSKKI